MTDAERKRWFEFVASLPCAHCGRSPVQVSHYQGISGSHIGRGGSKKSHHLMVWPACPECHGLAEAYRLVVPVAKKDVFIEKLNHSELMFRYIAQTIIAGDEAGILSIGIKRD